MNYTPWVESINLEIRQKWENTLNKSSNGFAVFYSPVNERNKGILIIGWNPGGGEMDFNPEEAMSIRITHEYATHDYPLALKMREHVFKAAGIPIEQTVKLNLIFFRTPNSSVPIDKELIQFSHEKVIEIIEVLKPKLIITEGFKTQQVLTRLFGGTIYCNEACKDYDIIRTGRIDTFTQPIYTIGLKHPSGARGVSNENLRKMGEHIGHLYNFLAKPKGDAIKITIAIYTKDEKVIEIVQKFAVQNHVSVVIIGDNFSETESFDLLVCDINLVPNNPNLLDYLDITYKEDSELNRHNLNAEVSAFVCITHTIPESVEHIRLLKYFTIQTALTESYLQDKIKLVVKAPFE